MDLVDRKTGKLVSIPNAEVGAAFKSGLYGLPKGASLPVAQPGLIGSVSAEDAPAALETMRPASPEEMQAATMQARYGGLGSIPGAGLAAVARGAGEAFGLPTDAMAGDVADLLSGDILHGGDAVRERLRAYQELHPGVSMAGELAGIAGATALSGGRTGLGAAGAIGERLAPAALGRVGAGVARGLTEGAMLGGVGAVNESALGDHELTGEKLVAGMGHGAFLGGALGGGFSALGLLAQEARDTAGRFASKLAPADIEAVAEKQFGYAPEGLGQRVQRAYAKGAAALSGKDANVIGTLTELSPEGAEARRVAVFDAPKIQEEAERAVREHVDNLLRSGDLVSAEARGSLKADYVARAVRTGNEAETRSFAQNQIARLIEGVDAELSHADGVAPQMVKPLETVSRAAYRAGAALEGANNASMFVELDNLKRSIQKLARTGYRSVANIADPLDQLSARRSVDFFRTAAEDVREGLEREDLWGKAASDQRTINAAWTKQLDAAQRFHRALTTETARDPSNPYVRLKGADPAKVASYVRNLTNPHNDLTHTAVHDFVGSTRELADAISKSYELPPEKVAEVARVRGAAEGFGKTIDGAEKSLVLANQYRALTEGTTDSLAGMLGAIGFSAGGLPGGILGAGVGAMANPGRTVAQLAAVERMVTKVDARIGSSVRDFFRGGARQARALEPHPASTPEGFDRMTKAVAKASSNPQAAMQDVARALGDLPDSAPKISTAAAAAALRVTSFLADKMPPAMRDPNELFPGDEPPLVSDTERETWARYVKASQDPASVLDHLARGDVTPEEVEALKACYPKLYAETQAKVQAATIQAAGAGKPLPYEKRIALGTLFEVPTDPTLAPGVMLAVAQARKRRGGGGGATGPARIGNVRAMAPRFMTTFEAASSRRKGGL